MGAGISGGDPRGAHEAGGRAPGGGRALCPRGQMVGPLVCSKCHKFLNILQKIIFHFPDGWSTFFGVFLLQG